VLTRFYSRYPLTMERPRVCIECGGRQAEPGTCAACGAEDTLDAREERVRELMRDIDLRRGLRFEARSRVIGVGLGMLIVIGLWLVPGWWSLRGRLYPGLPLFADQFALMIAIAWGTSKLFERLRPPPRFPYLRDDLTLE
jgi:hypothetical protein